MLLFEGQPVSSETTAGPSLSDLLVAANAGRNLGFGLVVGAVIAAGTYYVFVLSPEETVHDPLYYMGLAFVLGVSIALLLGIVLSAVTLARADQPH